MCVTAALAMVHAGGIFARACAQSRATSEKAISLGNNEGPLLRVVTEKAAPKPVAPASQAEDAATITSTPSVKSGDVKPDSPIIRIPLAQADSAVIEQPREAPAAKAAPAPAPQEAQAPQPAMSSGESDAAKEEPPKPTPAPQIPVKREAVGPEAPGQAPLKAVDAVPPSDAAPIAPDQLSAERTKMLTALNGQTAGVDLSSVIKDLPQTEAPLVSEEIRVDEAVAFALKNNFEVAAARHNKYSKRWEEVGAVGQFLPKGELTKAVGKQRSSPAAYTDAADQRIKDNTHHYRERAWSAKQTLVDLTLIGDLLSRHQLASAAEAEEQGARERIAMETMQAYYELIQASLLLRFAETYKQQLESLNERMQARVEGGGAAQAELDRIKARTLSAQSAILDSTQTFERTVFTLRRLTGVTPAKIAIPNNFLPYVPPDVEEIVRKSVTGNPEFLNALYRSNAADFDTVTALSRSLPKLAFEVSSSRSYNSGGAAFAYNSDDGGPFAYQNEKKAMLVLSWVFSPFVDGPQTAAAVSKARSEFYKSVDIRKKIEEVIRMSYSGLRTATSRIDAVNQSMISSVKVVEAFEAQYQNANRTMLDLLDAYERLYQSRAELVKIAVSEAKAGYMLRRQMGELVQALAVIEDRDPEVILPPMNGN